MTGITYEVLSQLVIVKNNVCVWEIEEKISVSYLSYTVNINIYTLHIPTCIFLSRIMYKFVNLKQYKLRNKIIIFLFNITTDC